MVLVLSVLLARCLIERKHGATRVLPLTYVSRGTERAPGPTAAPQLQGTSDGTSDGTFDGTFDGTSHGTSQGTSQGTSPGITETGGTAADPATPLAPSAETYLIDEKLLREEADWLRSCQLPGGAIKQTPSGDRVIPYFANLAARTMAMIEPQWAKDYMNWYLEHLNLPDRWGLAGTIYDYGVRDGVLIPTGDYDSADSYASTFLSLVADYYRETGDTDFILTNKDSIDLVAGVVLALQEQDGLVAAKPRYRTKYLMDNSENYRGLLDWADTLAHIGFPGEAETYREAAERIYAGIQNVLFDAETGRYAWSLSWLGKRYPREGRWYPDGVSQVTLISCGLFSPESSEAKAIWEWFNSRFPGWEEGRKKDVFPWGEVAITAAMMKDHRRVRTYVDWARQEFIDGRRQYPWYILESANLLRMPQALAEQLPPGQPAYPGGYGLGTLAR